MYLRRRGGGSDVHFDAHLHPLAFADADHDTDLHAHTKRDRDPDPIEYPDFYRDGDVHSFGHFHGDPHLYAGARHADLDFHFNSHPHFDAHQHTYTGPQYRYRHLHCDSNVYDHAHIHAGSPDVHTDGYADLDGYDNSQHQHRHIDIDSHVYLDPDYDECSRDGYPLFHNHPNADFHADEFDDANGLPQCDSLSDINEHFDTDWNRFAFGYAVTNFDGDFHLNFDRHGDPDRHTRPEYLNPYINGHFEPHGEWDAHFNAHEYAGSGYADLLGDFHLHRHPNFFTHGYADSDRVLHPHDVVHIHLDGHSHRDIDLDGNPDRHLDGQSYRHLHVDTERDGDSLIHHHPHADFHADEFDDAYGVLQRDGLPDVHQYSFTHWDFFAFGDAVTNFDSDFDTHLDVHLKPYIDLDRHLICDEDVHLHTHTVLHLLLDAHCDLHRHIHLGGGPDRDAHPDGGLPYGSCFGSLPEPGFISRAGAGGPGGGLHPEYPLVFSYLRVPPDRLGHTDSVGPSLICMVPDRCQRPAGGTGALLLAPRVARFINTYLADRGPALRLMV